MTTAGLTPGEAVAVKIVTERLQPILAKIAALSIEQGNNDPDDFDLRAMLERDRQFRREMVRLNSSAARAADDALAALDCSQSCQRNEK